MPGQSPSHVPSSSIPPRPRPLVRSIQAAATRMDTSKVDWPDPSSGAYFHDQLEPNQFLLDLTVPPSPHLTPSKGRGPRFPDAPRPLQRLFALPGHPGPALCKAWILPLCYKGVSRPFSRRPSLRTLASLPQLQCLLLSALTVFCVPCTLDPPVVPAQARCQLCKNKSSGRGISRMLPPLTLNSACLLPKHLWEPEVVTATGVPCPQSPLSAHWAVASSPATFLMPQAPESQPLWRREGADGPCFPSATERWLRPVPSPAPTQAGPRLFIVQGQTSGAQALPTPRAELSRPQLSKNRLHRVHTVVK